VAQVASASGPTQIERQDRQRQITVGAGYLGRSQGEVVADVQARLASLNLPAGVSTEFAGETELMQESFANLYVAMALAVVFVYMVLASQFGSFLQPLVIMLALPLAIIGAFLALLVSGKDLDMNALIGIILLFGVVTKNSILVVDLANRVRLQGVGLKEAVLTAGPLRLRPVLMTTFALIFGMLPVALGLGAGGEFRSPMAIAVIGGLITSTLLTLVVVPVIYSMVESLKLRLTGRKAQALPIREGQFQIKDGLLEQ
jgi:HAE1 family hydrophobic/amphiphilic exporter-1